MRRRGLLFASIVTVVAALSACDDAPPPTVTPTPVPGVSAASYLLRGAPVTAYQRTQNVGLTASQLAALNQAPGQLQELQQQGYQTGAQTVFQGPTMPTAVITPFFELQSSAFIFNDAAGAKSFYNSESQQLDQEANGGKVTAIANPPRANVDDLLALQEVNPPAAPGAPDNRAYVGLARHGRVVIQLFARINVNTTTVNDFLPLLAAQEAELATLP